VLVRRSWTGARGSLFCRTAIELTVPGVGGVSVALPRLEWPSPKLGSWSSEEVSEARSSILGRFVTVGEPQRPDGERVGIVTEAG